MRPRSIWESARGYSHRFSIKHLHPSRNWLVFIILIMIATARLSFATLAYTRPELSQANDSDRYVPIANAILARDAYAWNTDHPGELLNTIGYPLFLALVFTLRGHTAGDIAVAQLAITSFLAMALYLMLLRSIGTVAAFASAFLLAVDPLTILWSLTILTETLFATLLGIAALLLINWAVSGNRLTLVTAGLFSGLACLVRPLALPIIVLWTATLFLFPREVGKSFLRSISVGLKRAILYIAPVVILTLPWIIRNSLLWDCPTLSSVDRVTIRDYVAAKVISEYKRISLEEAQSRLQEADPGVCPRRMSEYLNIVRAHPQIYAKLHLAGTIAVLAGTNFDRWIQLFGVDYTLPDLWGPFMDEGIGRLQAILLNEINRFPLELALMFALTGFQFVIYALAALGCLSFRDVPRSLRWNIIILSAAALALILLPGQSGHERFRVSVQPLLVILAGYGISWRVLPLLERINRHRSYNL